MSNRGSGPCTDPLQISAPVSNLGHSTGPAARVTTVHLSTRLSSLLLQSRPTSSSVPGVPRARHGPSLQLSAPGNVRTLAPALCSGPGTDPLQPSTPGPARTCALDVCLGPGTDRALDPGRTRALAFCSGPGLATGKLSLRHSRRRAVTENSTTSDRVNNYKRPNGYVLLSHSTIILNRTGPHSSPTFILCQL